MCVLLLLLLLISPTPSPSLIFLFLFSVLFAVLHLTVILRKSSINDPGGSFTAHKISTTTTTTTTTTDIESRRVLDLKEEEEWNRFFSLLN